MVDLQPFAEAEAIVNAVAERESVCLKGYIVRSMSNDMVKFVPSLESPRRYFLIPKADIYHKIDIDLPPLGKGHMIWAAPRNIQTVEPGTPLAARGVQTVEPGTSLYDKDKALYAQEKVRVQCPSCKFLNWPGSIRCEKCGFEPLK